ncbi:MAG: two-component system phosphate regulon sensor histidine kinase PhoR [Litorivivens sp.]|jgi:two-component system phosphate regulon sensor histidine kinase PhoR
MASSTPRNLALNTSFVIALVVGISSAAMEYFFHEKLTIAPAVAFTSTLILCYYFISWSVEKFINEKVKIIYKVIHNTKNSKEQRSNINMNEDVLEKVNTEVVDWANNKVEEIKLLRQTDHYRREFVGNVSHELKTPTFNIQGYLLTLLDGGLEDPEHNRLFVEKAAKSAERMVSLLEDLDAISRIEAGELALNKSTFDIISLCKDVLDSLELRAKSRGIKLSISKQQELPIFVTADKNRIEQVLINLVLNSINYGIENGITKIRFFDMDDNFLIEVADNGIGIEGKYLPRLFERFYRVDKSRARNVAGSGLGLAIVKHLIEAHEQTINVRSTFGVGSTFSFTLEKARS